MTREQAIEVLGMVEAHGGIVIEAKSMAIEALKFQGKAEVVISQLREDRDRLLTILERIEKYLNNPNSGVNGLVHIDDVRGVMEDYEA